jgi:hypothetical protein
MLGGIVIPFFIDEPVDHKKCERENIKNDDDLLE